MKFHRNLFSTLFVVSLLFLGGCVSYKFQPNNLSKLSDVDICYQLAYNINKLSFKSREVLFNELIQRNTNCVDLAELIIEKRNNYLSKEGYPNDFFPESGEGASMPSQVREINVTNMAGSHGNK
ncbi:MAG: hypothetical protein CM15mP17_10850 [Gammaproteobacteria bacterium]|nr:MAG: hypothetical protein CM15mP17_10850 [Gammaproteobacteria bacterium]